MTTFRRDIQIVMLTMVAVVLFAGAALCPASAQTRYEDVGMHIGSGLVLTR